MRSPAGYALLLLFAVYMGLLFVALLPVPHLMGIVALAAVAGTRPRLRTLAAVVLIASVAALVATSRVADGIDREQTNVDASAVFRVVDFPRIRGQSVTLVLEPVTLGGLPRRLRVTWYDGDVTPKIGECWWLTVRLRRPRGFANPGGFDYEGWLFRNGIGATGYVRSAAGQAECRRSWVSRLRAGAAERTASLLPADQAAAVLRAITLGTRDGLSARQWERFAVTGTSHLMAISGMHIGLAAGASGSLCWALSAVLRRRANHRTFAAQCAALVALCYAIVSGFAVPARRACIMTMLACFAWCSRRRIPAWEVLGLAMIVVVVTSPIDTLSPGFQLSFAAVALLIWHAKRASQRSRGDESQASAVLARTFVAVQFALLFGLMPLTAVLFGRAAWLAPLTNLLVLPIFSLVSVPLALTGLVLTGPLGLAGDTLIWLSWHSLKVVLTIVDTAASLPHANLSTAGAHPFLGFAAVVVALLSMLPVGWPGRGLLWVALLTVGAGIERGSPTGCFDLHVLDVGQGLAAVVDVGDKTAVFDAGPAFRSGGDTGDLVVVPFLQALGKSHVDMLVVSHPDLDHAGGVASLLSAFPVRNVLAGGHGLTLAQPIVPCVRGQFWRWGEVTFSVLHPGLEPSKNQNDASCVLRIDTGARTVLLTGDIEIGAERRLLRLPGLSSVDIVTVPHHGSKTSSHAAFVSRLSASVAIVSAGFGNRWGFPDSGVLARWEDSGATVYNTARSGALSVRVCADGVRGIREHRTANRRVWRE
ncbi:MAG: DNA internalization-related competence protein ComEC/Rec2 [Pseudomonadota bacterium]